MPAPQEIVILDFGSQYSQLIARRVREAHVYSRMVSCKISASEIARESVAGIILSGGPASVYQEGAPKCDPQIFNLGLPILGICYGMQLTTMTLGGEVKRGGAREYGRATISQAADSLLFKDFPKEAQVWMSHGDKVTRIPEGFIKIATSENTEFAAIQNESKKIYGLQFHPEVVHTPEGATLIRNFCHSICSCRGDWTMASYLETATREIRETVGGQKVILGLSGGVDSSVAAALIHRAIGDQLTCIFVNNGLLRKNEAKRVQEIFGGAFKMPLKCIDATDLFLERLKGLSEPEAKRHAIGRTFVEVFEEAKSQEKDATFLAQGTTYPDVIESQSIDGNPSAVIKSHHNVGGLPEKMKFKLLEPLSRLFKDEVRELGRELGLPDEMVLRQPFPGPGLGVRILGEIDRQKLDTLREADAIIVEEAKKAGLYYRTWQIFGVFLPVRSVGVMGDERTYDNVIALRAVESQDGMTADWSRLPYDLLARISDRIVNEVKGVNRVVYDITSKPPGTIEWE